MHAYSIQHIAYCVQSYWKYCLLYYYSMSQKKKCCLTHLNSTKNQSEVNPAEMTELNRSIIFLISNKNKNIFIFQRIFDAFSQNLQTCFVCDLQNVVELKVIKIFIKWLQFSDHFSYFPKPYPNTKCIGRCFWSLVIKINEF